LIFFEEMDTFLGFHNTLDCVAVRMVTIFLLLTTVLGFPFQQVNFPVHVSLLLSNVPDLFDICPHVLLQVVRVNVNFMFGLLDFFR
jgi:hypothetical protein